MKVFDTIYDPNVLNIFTDASMYSGKYKGYSVGCAGVELATAACRYDVSNNLYQNGYIPNYVITLDTTNNNSELIAIRQGILFAIANKDRFNEINLFSDSLISVKALREWIEGWFYKSLKKSQNENITLTTASGAPVANQDIIKNIVALIYYNNLSINIYHQRGHCSNDLDTVKKDFIKMNNIKSLVYDSFIKQISDINDVVDRRSRYIMKTFVQTGYAPYVVNNTLLAGVEYDISKIYFKKYKQLIGRK